MRDHSPNLTFDDQKLYPVAAAGILKEQYLTLYGEDEEYNGVMRQVDIFVHIMSHPYDRQGTFAWLEHPNSAVSPGSS